MIYKFKCNKCNETRDIIMPISQYISTGHKCDKCGEELVRDLDNVGVTSVWKCDGACGYIGN